MDQQFGILAKVFGKPEWSDNPKFKTNSQRIVNKDELISDIKTIFKAKSTEYVS